MPQRPVKQSEPDQKRRTRARKVQPQVHFLDMGKDRYGDCIIVKAGRRSVMIDGAHPRDLMGQSNTPSVPEQLSQIFGHAAPFKIDLIVVTHGHNDHIGCLPELIEQGIVRPRFALLSDPAHCFPPGARDQLPEQFSGDDALGAVEAETIQRVLTGLAEEDHSDLPPDEIALFLDRTMKLGPRYRAMVEQLGNDSDVDVILWGTTPPEQLMPIFEALDGTGFDIIAPSLPHLELCRDQIMRYARDSAGVLHDALSRLPVGDVRSPTNLATLLYRQDNSDPATALLLDRMGQGSALNCQSIMLVFGHGERKVLLTGDMQFAEPEVRGLEPHMEHLLGQAVAAGPFHCVKLPHHSSYNGIDKTLWSKLGKPPLVVHSGGSNDPSHPEPSILNEFRSIDDEIAFLRTDRNGLISVDLAKDEDYVSISRGQADDFTTNRRRRDREEEVEGAAHPPVGSPAFRPGSSRAAMGLSPRASDPSTIDVIVVRLPLDHELRIGEDTIEVRKPESRSAASSTRLVSPGSDPGPRLASGRDIGKLLFVTNRSGLERNVGVAEADLACDLIARDAELLDVGSASDPQGLVHSVLDRGDHSGIVLVGGYDILPSDRVDVLDPALRSRIRPDEVAFDPDEFIVWSDDGWGDPQGSGTARLPISRIPDGRSGELVMASLTADAQAPEGAFGIRNEARPFAKAIFRLLSQEEALSSAPLHVSQLDRDAPARRHVYFMLHGDDRDASRFWGDDVSASRVLEAINVGALPLSGLDIVFAGCCWGALSVLQRANNANALVAPRSPEESMALACLRSGARAFVGCTGVHYSPGEEGGFFGAPMHDAFWKEALGGRPPAEALFRARANYLVEMPHNRRSALEIGIERKIYKQFTCLGLGW